MLLDDVKLTYDINLKNWTIGFCGAGIERVVKKKTLAECPTLTSASMRGSERDQRWSERKHPIVAF